MADETNTNTNTTAPATEVAQAEPKTEGERVYTQAEVDALLRQTKDSTFAEARRTLKPKRQDEAKAEKATSIDKGEDREARREAQSDAINDAVDEYGIGREQKTKLRELIRKEDPDDPAAWVKSMMALFGKVTSQKTDTPTAQPKEASVARTPGDHPGPSQGIPAWERPGDPFKWSEEDVERLVALKGPRAAHKLIRTKAEAHARTMRIQMSPNRRP